MSLVLSQDEADTANTLTLVELQAWLSGPHPGPITKFAVTGSREFYDWRIMWAALACVPRAAMMFNGWAYGADCLAQSFWRAQGGSYRQFKPRWASNPRGAGLVRNVLMMEHMPHVVLAFLASPVQSTGTRHAIDQAAQRGIPVFTFHQFVPDKAE